MVVWPQKTKDVDNQLWMYDHGYIINKNSGMGKVYTGILKDAC